MNDTPKKKRKWPWVAGGLFVLLVGFVGYVACALSPNLDAGQTLPGVALTQLEGGEAFDLNTLRGKYVLLDFWSST